jgi:hypothetical protein
MNASRNYLSYLKGFSSPSFGDDISIRANVLLVPISGSGKHPTLANPCQTFKTKALIPKT